MTRPARVLIAAVLVLGLVACEEAKDDDTAQRARERLSTNIDSTRSTATMLLQQIDAVPDVRFSRGIADAVGNTYGSFFAVVRDLRVPDAALRDLRALQSAAGAVQTYGNRAGKAMTDAEFTLAVAAVKQKIGEFDIAAVQVLAKLDRIVED